MDFANFEVSFEKNLDLAKTSLAKVALYFEAEKLLVVVSERFEGVDFENFDVVFFEGVENV